MNRSFEQFLADLPTRAYNVLDGLGCKSFEDVEKLRVVDLLRTRNCGHKSMRQIRQALADEGRRLRGDGPVKQLEKAESALLMARDAIDIALRELRALPESKR